MERDLLPLSDWAFARISRLMHETIGLALNETKKHFIQCRLAPRIQKLGLPGFDHYLALITSDGDEGEFQVAVDLLTTNETYFFREPEHFEIIAGHARRLKSRSFSVWSAASSFGDEAYSIAMLLAELQTQGHVGADWSILGTDISDRALRAAVEAVFPEERLLRVPPAYVRRYCLRGEGEAVPALLGMVIRELQTASTLARAGNLAAAFKSLRVWDAKQPMYRRALQRHDVRRW